MHYFFKIAILFVFLQTRLSAQIISGVVYHHASVLESATVDVFDQSDSLLTSVLTDRKGKFIIRNVAASSTVKLEIRYLGLTPFVRSLVSGDSRDLGKISLETMENELEEVNVDVPVNQIIVDGNKRVYLLNQADFIKNSTADMAINKVPGIVFAEGLGFKVDGFQQATLYVDGVKTELNQLKAMDVEDILKIEIISNPSSRHTAEDNFAVVNIVLKKHAPSFYKGKVSAVKGILLERTGVLPSLSLKKGNWLMKSNFGFSQYNQFTETDISRSFDAVDYRQAASRKTEIEQREATVSINYNIDTVTSLLVRADYFGYGLKGNTTGSISNNLDDNNFSNVSRDSYHITSLDAVFERGFNNHTVTVKTKYNNYQKEDRYTLSGSDDQQGSVKSHLSDLTFEANFGSNFKSFEGTEQNSGLKFTDRSFKFDGNQISLKQQNFGAYTEWSLKLNKYFDVAPGMYLDVSRNRIATTTRDYVSLLPSLSFGLRHAKIGRLGISYSRKVQRPTPMDLNDAVIAIDPTTFEMGNSELKQSYTNSFNISIAKPYRKNFFSTNLIYSYNDQSIFQDVQHNNDTLYYIKSNIGSIQRIGLNIGHDFFIRKGFNIYTSSGVSYNRLEKGGTQSAFNSGYGFIATVNVTALIFKRVQSSVLFDYNSRRYDLYSIAEERPFTNISMATNFFKNSLNVRATYVDLFRINSMRYLNYSLPTFKQVVAQNRNFSNINLTLTYSFGKKFSDSISQSPINHNDLELR